MSVAANCRRLECGEDHAWPRACAIAPRPPPGADQGRPGLAAPTANRPSWPAPPETPAYAPTPKCYCPKTGNKRRAGGLEVLPPRGQRKPSVAKPFYRQWGVESEPLPATVPVPYEPP